MSLITSLQNSYLIELRKRMLNRTYDNKFKKYLFDPQILFIDMIYIYDKQIFIESMLDYIVEFILNEYYVVNIRKIKKLKNVNDMINDKFRILCDNYNL